jgi:integrase
MTQTSCVVPLAVFYSAAMNINISRRKRRRVQRSGAIRHQVRFVVSWHTEGQRIQRFFETHKQAQAYRTRLLIDGAERTRPIEASATVGDAITAWMESKRRSCRGNTYQTYQHRIKLLEPLARVRIDSLNTRDIRAWHERVAGTGTIYSAGRALSILKSVLALHAEDTGTRPIAFPTNLQKRQECPKRTHFSIDQVKVVIAYGDIYTAWPFLTGTRISEQLGMHWQDIDFETGIIRICRTQDKVTGALSESTKTASSNRRIPMGETLRRMLLDWKGRCSSEVRVFPAPNGGPLLYSNYLHRVWQPSLRRMGLPYVSIHSARASFISMLQHGGTPVATAALLAGHVSPSVTMKHYSHDLGGGAEAIRALDGSLMEPLTGTAVA